MRVTSHGDRLGTDLDSGFKHVDVLGAVRSGPVGEELVDIHRLALRPALDDPSCF